MVVVVVVNYHRRGRPRRFRRRPTDMATAVPVAPARAVDGGQSRGSGGDGPGSDYDPWCGYLIGQRRAI